MAGFLHQQRATRRRARDSAIDWGWAFDRAAERLTRWGLGAGFLRLHAYAFLATAIGVTLWRMFSRPDDVRIDGIFIVWGALVLLHAGLVLITTIGIRLTGSSDRDMPTSLPARPWTGLASDGGPPDPSGAPRQPQWATQAESVAGGARRRAGQATAQALVDLGDLITEGTTFVARATRRRVTHFTRSQSSASPPQSGWSQAAGNAGQPSASAYDDWAAAAQAFALNASRAAPGAPHDGTSSPSGHDAGPAGAVNGAVTWNSVTAEEQVDQVISVTPASPMSANGHRPDESDPTRRWIDSYLDSPDGERDARWTWIEAAASSWLARGGELVGESSPALPPPSEAEQAVDAGRTVSPDTHANGPAASGNGAQPNGRGASANGTVTATNGNGHHAAAHHSGNGPHNGTGHHGPHGA